MAVQSIVKGDVPELRVMCNEVDTFDMSVEQLVQDLADTMYATGGIGLAAPQIGHGTRALVVDVGDGLIELLNPVVTRSEGEQQSVESCLSFPGLTLEISRPATMTVRGVDRFGGAVEYDAIGLLARVLSHELDHLDGVLFMDRLSDEEVFAQMFQQVSEGLGDELDEAEDAVDMTTIDSARLAEAQHAELYEALDLMADGAWKVRLAIELARDASSDVEDRANVDRLEDCLEALQQAIDDWERALEDTLPQS